jgi:serine/threonine protein phosphatase PrpC
VPYTIVCTQHCGKDKRYPQQQDSLWNGKTVFKKRNLLPEQYVAHGESIVVAVADGVGCSPRAELAGLSVLQALANESPGNAFDIYNVWRSQEKVCKRRGTNTLAGVCCFPDNCQVFNAGDSRVYRITTAGEWQQLSADDAANNAMMEQERIEAGMADASVNDALDSSLVADGEERELSIQVSWAIHMEVGDTLLLYTDGVHGTLANWQLQSLFDANLSPKDQAQVWRDAVLEAGAPDSFSLIVVRYDALDGVQNIDKNCL